MKETEKHGVLEMNEYIVIPYDNSYYVCSANSTKEAMIDYLEYYLGKINHKLANAMLKDDEYSVEDIRYFINKHCHYDEKIEKIYIVSEEIKLDN